MKGLIIDAQIAGVSGDMFLGSLVDLFYSEEPDKKKADRKREELLGKLTKGICNAPSLGGRVKLHILLNRINQFAVSGVQLKIELEEPHRHLKIHQAKELLDECCEQLNLSSKATEFCHTAFRILFEAEATVHGETLENAHLHEAGSLDTFLDVVGVAYLLEKMALFNVTIFVLPVALGFGSVTFSHGTLSVPAPAVVEIVRKYQIPVHTGHLSGELTTPTGAILLASLMTLNTIQKVTSCPIVTIEKIGIGFGTKKFDKTPNGFRLIQGTFLQDDFSKEEITLIETNIDDCTGETIGFLSQKLLDQGAKDVFLTPIYMKKGRPGTKISVLCNPDEVEKFATEIMTQTSTIGVRILSGSKLMLHREIKQFKIQIGEKEFTICGKIAFNTRGEIAHFKPEFDDVKRITEETGLTINAVQSISREIMSKELRKNY